MCSAGQADEAVPLYQEAIDIKSKEFMPEHPQVVCVIPKQVS